MSLAFEPAEMDFGAVHLNQKYTKTVDLVNPLGQTVSVSLRPSAKW